MTVRITKKKESKINIALRRMKLTILKIIALILITNILEVRNILNMGASQPQ